MSTKSEVDELIDDAQGYAAGAIEQSTQAVNELIDATDDIGGIFNRTPDIQYSPIGSIDFSGIGKIDPKDKPSALDLSKYIGLSNVAPTAPVLSEVSAPQVQDIAAFEEVAPQIATPAAPAAYTPDSIPDAPEIDTTVALPDVPDVDLPDAPEFEAFVIPDAPAIDAITAFEDVAPEFFSNAPSPVINFSEQAYVSTLKDAARNWLENQIANGGTGIATAVEQGIWERGMAREVESARRNIENAVDEFAASGFPAPPGALRARKRAIRNDLQNRSDDLSRKIAEDQAKLAQDNTQFAITQGIELESLELQHMRAVADRALEFAKATAAIALDTFNAKISAYNVQVEAYRTKVQVYEVNVRAALQQIETYKAVLEGKRIEATLRQSDIELYKSKIQGVESLFGLYRTQLEGERTKIELGRSRVDVYRAQIDGSIAQIRAKESEYGLYRAQQDGEMNKVRLYTAQLDGYKAKIGAESTKYDMLKSKFDADTTVQRQKIESYRAQLDGYVAEVNKNRSAIEALLGEYQGKSNLYEAEIRRASEEYRLSIQESQLELERGRHNSAELNQRYRSIAELALNESNSRIAGYGKAADSAAALAAAALSQINAVAHTSHHLEESEE